MKKMKLFGLVAAALMAIAAFLPWIGVSSSVSMSGVPGLESLGGGFSGSYGGSISMSGINFWGGSLGILIAIIGAILIYKDSILATGAGISNLVIGVGYIFGWFIAGAGSFNMSANLGGYGNVSTGMNPQFGLYIFAICSLLFIITSIINSTNNYPDNIALNTQTSDLIDQATQYLKQPVQTTKQQESQTCESCKTHYPLTAKFCPDCGTPANKEKFCGECGTKVNTEVKFCPNCGKTIGLSAQTAPKVNTMEDDL